MPKLTYSEAHARVLQACASPAKLAIRTGAGTSAESGLPLGDDLTESILRLASDPVREGSAERIRLTYQRLYPAGDRAVPRLEFLLDRISAVLGEGSLAQILGLFGRAKPKRAIVLTYQSQKGGSADRFSAYRQPGNPDLDSVDKAVPVMHIQIPKID